jgi:hypothetical protein
MARLSSPSPREHTWFTSSTADMETRFVPALHRYLGNPVLTAIGRLFFHSPSHDFHCGIRAFRKDSYDRMDIRSRHGIRQRDGGRVRLVTVIFDLIGGAEVQTERSLLSRAFATPHLCPAMDSPSGP